MNYGENAQSHNQRFYGWSLFSPQLDVYAFQKCHHDGFPVITAPVSLHNVHNDGYPFVMVYQDGRAVYKGGASPYAAVFDSLRARLWPGERIPLRLASPLKFSDNLTLDDSSCANIQVVVDSDTARFNRAVEFTRRFPHFRARYESELTPEDLQCALEYIGRLDAYSFKHFAGQSTVIRFDRDSLWIGGIAFARATVGVLAWFPNPFNPERPVVIDCRRARGWPHNWADFWVQQPDKEGNATTLLEGCFAKQGGTWTLSPAMTYGPAKPAGMCEGNRCPGPPGTQHARVSVTALAKACRGPEKLDPAQIWSLGEPPSRFPSLAVGDDGVCRVAWGQNGDIVLAELRPDERPNFIPVETDSADGYNPVLAVDKGNTWVFFVCDADGFYRLYGTCFDGYAVSRTTLISESGPFNCETPAAIANFGGTITVFWSEMKANFRWMKYRTISNGILGAPTPAPLKPAGPDDDYANAWFPSLATAADGSVWAAWNQHYPTTLGAYAGKLGDQPTTIEQKGGYPSIGIGPDGKPCAVWQAWRTSDDGQRTQIISCSWFDDASRQWSVPKVLSRPEQSMHNETPKITCASDGTLWTCWSGRKDYESPWKILLCHFHDGVWSEPEIVSSGNDHARAPVVAAGSDSDLWLAWHEGTGSQMRITVWYRAGDVEGL